MITMIEYSLTKLSPENAKMITLWRYPPPYDLYDLSERDLLGFINPDYRYHQVEDQDGLLVGYCCFGEDATVPGGDYKVGEPEILDVGVGLKPELTGKGLGKNFVRAVVDYGIINFGPEKLRVTVARFNQRSLRTFLGLGFEITRTFTRDLVEIEFCQLEKSAHEV